MIAIVSDDRIINLKSIEVLEKVIIGELGVERYRVFISGVEHHLTEKEYESLVDQIMRNQNLN